MKSLMAMAVVIFCFGAVANAGSDCSDEKGDEYFVCAAIQKNSELSCESVEDESLRYYCHAVVAGDKGYCDIIDDDATRRRCNRRLGGY